MADVDKVLEAEQAIQDMAVELKRMKSAADLLSGSQEKVDAVIKAGDAVVKKAGAFAVDSAEIIKRLKAIDLEKRLNELREQGTTVMKALEDLRSEVHREMDEANTKLVSIREEQDAMATQLAKAVQSAHDEASKSRKLILILTVVNLVLLVAVIVLLFLK